MRRTIVYFHSGHANDAASLAYMQREFGELGYTIEDFSVMSPTVIADLNDVLVNRGSEIAFFLSSNYNGARMANAEGQLLHTFTGIPLVIMHHDHPLHFLGVQTAKLDGTVSFVIGDEAADFMQTYFLIETSFVTRLGSRPHIAQRAPRYDRFLKKQNTILCPMNLVVNDLGPNASWELIRALPEPRRMAAARLAEIAVADCRTPLHEIARTLAPQEQTPELWDQLLVHNFIKAWRRNAMVRALIDLPILISTENAPADLASKYPKKFTLLSRTQTMPLYDRYRFVLNCNPVSVDVLHERLLEALYANSVAISDTNRSIGRYLRDEREYLAFSFGDAGAAAKIAAYLDDPAKAFALTEHAYAARQASQEFGLPDGYRRLTELIESQWAARLLPAGGVA